MLVKSRGVGRVDRRLFHLSVAFRVFTKVPAQSPVRGTLWSGSMICSHVTSASLWSPPGHTVLQFVVVMARRLHRCYQSDEYLTIRDRRCPFSWLLHLHYDIKPWYGLNLQCSPTDSTISRLIQTLASELGRLGPLRSAAWLAEADR